MIQQILNQNNKVIYQCEVSDNSTVPLRDALLQAVSENVNLTGAYLANQDFEDINLSGAILSNVNFFESTLVGANFSYCILNGANFNRADLRGSIFSNTNIDNATFVESIFDQDDNNITPA